MLKEIEMLQVYLLMALPEGILLSSNTFMHKIGLSCSKAAKGGSVIPINSTCCDGNLLQSEKIFGSWCLTLYICLTHSSKAGCMGCYFGKVPLLKFRIASREMLYADVEG